MDNIIRPPPFSRCENCRIMPWSSILLQQFEVGEVPCTSCFGAQARLHSKFTPMTLQPSEDINRSSSISSGSSGSSPHIRWVNVFDRPREKLFIIWNSTADILALSILRVGTIIFLVLCMNKEMLVTALMRGGVRSQEVSSA